MTPEPGPTPETSAQPERWEIVVVGAGTVGLSLALALARAGRRVLVLEKESSTAEHSRAPAIWPRTQEILSELGMMDAFLAHGITLPRVDLRDAATEAVLLSIPIEALAGETPFPHLLIVPQSVTECLLRGAVATQPTASVLFSAEVTRVDRTPSGLRVGYRRQGSEHGIAADFVVGCDGAGSTVREALGISFGGKTYATRAALADLRLDVDPMLPFPRLSTRSGLAVAIRIDTGLWRLILPFGARDDQPLGERVEAAARRLFPGVRSAGDHRVVWQSEFRLHRRLAGRFVDGRVALAGDAAHLNSPVGGQGMNAGIQDVPVLTAALVRALERDDPAILAQYERTRRPAVEGGVNVFTDRLTRLLLLGHGRAIRPVLWLLRATLRIPPLRRRFLRRIAMLDAAPA